MFKGTSFTGNTENWQLERSWSANGSAETYLTCRQRCHNNYLMLSLFDVEKILHYKNLPMEKPVKTKLQGKISNLQ